MATESVPSQSEPATVSSATLILLTLVSEVQCIFASSCYTDAKALVEGGLLEQVPISGALCTLDYPGNRIGLKLTKKGKAKATTLASMLPRETSKKG